MINPWRKKGVLALPILLTDMQYIFVLCDSSTLNIQDYYCICTSPVS